MFVPNQQLKSALGTFQNPKQQQYYKSMCQLFKPMNKPQSGDWLYSHSQKHQAFADYKLPNYNQVTNERKTIYIQQFGKFNKQFISSLCKFCKVFYPNMNVDCLPVLDFNKELPTIKKRQNCYGDQFLAQDILAYMEKRVPKDAYCVMGITLNDIYPGDNWNYVYGWAKYKARVGIFSFLRWDDEFADGKTQQIDWNLILYPSMRTMVHQIGHMFAITHCVYYRCLMNGFNHISQNYLNPLQFCPICYRKIVKNIGFDMKVRYQKLIQFCKNSEIKQLKVDQKLYEQLLQINKKIQIGKQKSSTQTQVTKNNINKTIQATNKTRGQSLQVGIRRR